MGLPQLDFYICECRSLMESYHILFSFNIATDVDGPFGKSGKVRAMLASGWAYLQQDAVPGAEGESLVIPKPRNGAIFIPRAPHG